MSEYEALRQQHVAQATALAPKLIGQLDWPAGRLYHSLGLEVPLYTPFFVSARVTGWCAHIIEQQAHNRIIRPRGRYIGPNVRPVAPLNERG